MFRFVRISLRKWLVPATFRAFYALGILELMQRRHNSLSLEGVRIKPRLSQEVGEGCGLKTRRWWLVCQGLYVA